MKLRFQSKQEIQSGVFTFVFEPQEQMVWQPGQYMHYFLKHAGADDRGEERWFTISSAPYEERVQLTTRWSGDKASSFKKAMFALKPGDELEAEGPGGKFVWQAGNHRHVLVAGGIGITPFRSILLQLDHDGKEIDADLLYANRDDNFVFGAELSGLAAKHSGLRINKFVGKEITLKDLKPFIGLPGVLFYLSGPESMVDSFKDQLLVAGAGEESILKDRFPGYSNVASA